MIPDPILEAMCEAAYEATKARSAPGWAQVLPTYQNALRMELRAAVQALERRGWKLVAPPSEISDVGDVI